MINTVIDKNYIPVIKTDKWRDIILVSQQLHLITYDPISQF